MNTELMEVSKETALEAYTSGNGLDDQVNNVRDLVDNFEHDMSTAASRKETASFAHKISKLKKSLDNVGADLTEEWREKTGAVNASRKTMRESMDLLRDEARAPLTAWEKEKEKADAEEFEQQRLAGILIEFNRDHEMALLMANEFDRKAKEAAKAEVGRLAALEKERLLKIKADEKAAVEAEKQRIEDAKESARVEAAEKAQAAIDKKEADRLAAIESEKQAKIDLAVAEDRAKVEAQRVEDQRAADMKAATERAAKQVQAAKDEAKTEAAEKLRLETLKIAKLAQTSKILTAAKNDLILLGLTEKLAKHVVKAIAKGKVSNVSITL